MAEIGLVASIFGVAAFGTNVAKSLYETGDVMVHAHQQIASMAKHVSQFTAVLRHLGRVLEAEKGNCSKGLLRDIKKLQRSCKSTFKEINATIRSKSLRPFIPVRWLFKKSKAKELEARLDSQQFMLQTMIQSVTVSKLGVMQSSSKEDSQQISILRQEIDHLKTLIVENYASAAELRRAEQSTEAEHRRSDFPEFDMGEAPRVPSPTPSSHGSSSPDSDNEVEATASMFGEREPQLSPGRNDQERSRDLRRHSQEGKNNRLSAVQPPQTIDSTPPSVKLQASSMLLQMIPYRPVSSNPANLDRSGRLIAFRPSIDDRFETDAKPPMEEATKSVRLLLDKWTTSGSAPIDAILNEEQNQDNITREARNPRNPKTSFRGAHPRPYSPINDSSDDEFDNQDFFPSSTEPRRHMPGYHPSQRSHYFPNRPSHAPFLLPGGRAVWKDAHIPNHYMRDVGDILLNGIRSTRGGINYMKLNEFRCEYYVDDTVIHTFDLVPYELVPYVEQDALFTEIGSGWVRREVLDLLGYSYSVTRSAHYSISGNLDLTEIEDLVRLSSQGFYRGLQKLSAQKIDERGWRENVNARRANSRYPRSHDWNGDKENPFDWNGDSYQGPSVSAPGLQDLPLPTSSPNRYPAGKVVGVQRNGDKFNWNSDNYQGPIASAPRLQDLPLPTSPANRYPAKKVVAVQPVIESKPIEPEVRFIFRGGKSSLHNTTMPPRTEPETDPRALKLQQAREKLEQLLKKRDEAEKANDISTASDLTYYAIPDMRDRIEKLEGGKKEDQKPKSQKPTPQGKQARAPPTEVKTDSSGSSDEECGSKANDSDASLAAGDLYE